MAKRVGRINIHTCDLKKEKGITLIALVITIIVLLILAGVSIVTLTGENGLIGKAIEAERLYKIEQEKEIISIAYMSMQDKQEITKEMLKDEIQKLNKEVTVDYCNNNGEIIEQSNYVKITFVDTKNWYVINLSTGKIEKYGTNGEIIHEGIKEGDISIYNLEDLKAFQNLVNEGATFKGYTVTLEADIDLKDVCGEGIGNWKPIGNYNVDNNLCFEGNFEGKNHTISNIYINDTTLDYQRIIWKCEKWKYK